MKTTTADRHYVPGTCCMPGINPLVRFLAGIKNGVPSALRYGNRTQAEAKLSKIREALSAEGNSVAVIQVESRFLITAFPAEYDLDQKSGKLAPRICNVRKPSAADKGDHCKRPVAPGSTKCRLRGGGVSFQKIGEVKDRAAKGAQELTAAFPRRRPPFATVSGRRINPRNRHNQNSEDGWIGPVYCQQGSASKLESGGIAKAVADLLAKGTAKDRRSAYRAVSDRLNGRSA